MRRPKAPPKITPTRLDRGCDAFKRHEGRDSMYRVATFLLKHSWGRHAEMADALTVLLLTWNNAFYRYGLFDQRKLEAFLGDYWGILEKFRRRRITSFSDKDHLVVSKLFLSLLAALRISKGKGRGRKSPVAVAKTLHLLAPRFFPLWDQAIAVKYGCNYMRDPADAYIRFCIRIRNIEAALPAVSPGSPKSLLKRIDEFNYAKFTQGWI